MGVTSTIWLGRLVLYGGAAFVALYVTNYAGFRDQVNKIIMGTGARVAHITNTNQT